MIHSNTLGSGPPYAQGPIRDGHLGRARGDAGGCALVGGNPHGAD